ncbi:hypothetical protein D7B24_003224 [Verticillium nonalfalfae]|uniref:BZIP domain-containing protein n=1 Tax=Verticillium nonalfalfae TaxID=1051616 RepID=A0A3M9YGD6_9PEZI|nr:uncharacterized protein D7B24_003224 [Verticillium nonalfalfae]RNJ59131.1 hypothetical protein D7B24_003224 [Verticillium nonalfalfae]
MAEAGEFITVATSPPSTSAKPQRRSRAVSNLTRQQVQHKRDQDRRAQRALRERNKTRVESLESTITCLKSTHAEEIAAQERAIKNLNDEVRQLRQQIQQLSASGTATSTGLHASVTPSASWTSPSEDLPVVEDEDGRLPWQPGWFAMPDVLPRAPQVGKRIGDPGIQTSPDTCLSRNENAGSEDEESSNAASTSCRQESVALAVPFSAHTLKGLTTRQSGPSVSDAACQTELATTICTALPRHLPPSTPLDHILLGFLRFHSHPTSTDAAQPLMGGSDVSLKAYLHPELSGSIDPISRLMNEVLSTFAHVRAPEKISFIRAQWQVYPAKSTFADLPRWLRPTATQITVPHDAWIDNIPCVYSQCVTVNWPYDVEDIISEQGHDLIPNKIFEKHIQRLGNWTVSRDFEELYPEMVRAIYSRD